MIRGDCCFASQHYRLSYHKRSRRRGDQVPSPAREDSTVWGAARAAPEGGWLCTAPPCQPCCPVPCPKGNGTEPAVPAADPTAAFQGLWPISGLMSDALPSCTWVQLFSCHGKGWEIQGCKAASEFASLFLRPSRGQEEVSAAWRERRHTPKQFVQTSA